MKELIPYTKNYRKQLFLGPFFKLLEAIFELLLPMLMAYLVDSGIQKGDTGVVLQAAGGMLALSLIGLVCVLICQYYASIASQGYGTDLRNAMMAKINALSYRQLNRFGTDTLITRLTNDVNQIQTAVAMLIRLVIRAPFLSIGSVVMAFIIDWRAGLLFAILLPLFAVIMWLISRWTVPLYRRLQTQFDGLNQRVMQNLDGVRVIRAFARKKTETQKGIATSEELTRTAIHVTNLSALLTPLTSLIMNGGIILLLTIGGQQVSIGNLQQGQVLALINYLTQMLLALIVVSNLVVIFTRADASVQRVSEVLATPVDESESHGSLTPAPTSTVYQFDHVNFRYTEKSGYALTDLSFTVKKGQLIGITGPTGSGKSTLTQLLGRFYTAEGRLTFYDTPIEDWEAFALRQQLAYVPQGASLFSGTIRSNLLWGKADATETECWQALDLAAADFVRTMPEGLDTPVVEGGLNFSGGQKQRLTIARALIRKPAVLVLDDALSALDYQTELQLRQGLRQAFPETTIFIISQRISAITAADQIFYLAEGKLLGKGTHEELLATCTGYQELAASQGGADHE
ncbi:ABC transporter ATP-binding/permease [Enterococcus canis]|uniref:ABC transporter ATP-binding/permease n=1 Tax=Enterococcus canis TaxID=214095 RepID=A0A1L8RFV0_9ENTE|nr:ABC transporter ATP-binding protein [Enterococcus canis]OJG18603.1 ABC transporter ATP-binding/permease [Enterococcus canis]